MKNFLETIILKLNKISKYDHITFFKKTWKLATGFYQRLVKPHTLIVLITICSILSIVLSSTLFYFDNKKDTSFFSSLYVNDLTNRFVAKNDILRLNHIISQIHFCSTSGNGESKCAFVPLEPSFMQQAYMAHEAMKGKMFVSTSFLQSIDTPKEYYDAIDQQAINNANAHVFQNVYELNKIEITENKVFWFLSLVQILNAFFAITLFYQERKERTAKQ
ncbi:MAG: hypothetical protein A2589_00875 [Candidatus Vogelbacteria bacterium RIFOXYD1_FULL_46_19]|uniref:Uncharacterized protein n=1 Tax=Candidatus Vogelbacteria bacterium RIFOXYD1_FULL_46_19 TaxID=1802439 RepID=A0A1G2QG86_9BACT|nr:MAG: hypothetical protein A2589_00875 [Candidatus Vogelbacteria bacterium RIFOXYD1_FULL_46_19]